MLGQIHSRVRIGLYKTIKVDLTTGDVIFLLAVNLWREQNFSEER